jgi:voltage-gated potassium channel
VTVTTVGYGDKFPITPGGRAIATVLMFSGIALVSVLTAALATFFVSRLRSDRANAQTSSPAASQNDAPWLAILDRLTAIEATLAQLATEGTLPDESTI